MDQTIAAPRGSEGAPTRPTTSPDSTVSPTPYRAEMSRIEKGANLGAVVVPFAATLAAIVLFWNRLVSPADLAIAAVMYMLTAVGITVGFHRLLTHRSFQTSKPVEYAFAVFGSMAVQGPVISWVADHRKHHAHTDEEGDPHSPHIGHAE